MLHYTINIIVVIPASTKHRSNVVSILGQRCRQWYNIQSTDRQVNVFNRGPLNVLPFNRQIFIKSSPKIIVTWKVTIYSPPVVILWNSMTSTSFVFIELANTMKYVGGLLYNLDFTDWRHCVSQNCYPFISKCKFLYFTVVLNPVLSWGWLTAIIGSALAARPTRCTEAFFDWC